MTKDWLGILARGLLGAGLCCGAAPAVAQSSEQDFLGDLPVVLSVSRLAQPLDEAPGAVTVIDRDTIRRSGAREMAEVLRLVPGFIVSHLQSGGRPIVSYHADYDSITRHLQVYIDGRSVYSSLLVGTANHGLMGIVLDDIERIEVLRGSNSAAYGANAFLGVVNIVTRHAADTRGGMVATHLGADGVRDATARVGWGDERAAFRFTAATRRDSGFDGFYDDKRVDQAHFRGDLRPTAADDLTILAGHTEHTWGLDKPNPRDESWRNTYASAQWTRHLNGTDQLKFGAQFDEERYIDFNPRYAADGVGRRVELEAQHTFSPREHWRFVWGGQYRDEQVTSALLFSDQPRQRFHLWRVFGNAEWKPDARWVLNVGGLWENHSVVGASTAPRLMAHYHAAAGHTLRAGTTTAYKQPTLFELRTHWRDYNGALRFDATGGARAERIDATEIGYLGELRKLNLAIDLRVFREHVRDLLAYRAPCENGQCPLDIVNKDPNTQHGWEAQLRWQPLADTRVLFNYTRLKLAPEADSTAPQDAYRAPRHNAMLALFQQFPGGYDLALIHTYVGEYFYVRNSDRVPAHSQTDLRLARQFRLGATRAEAALTVRAAGGGHIDFVERGQPAFLMDRRAFASLRLEF